MSRMQAKFTFPFSAYESSIKSENKVQNPQSKANREKRNFSYCFPSPLYLASHRMQPTLTISLSFIWATHLISSTMEDCFLQCVHVLRRKTIEKFSNLKVLQIPRK